MRSGGVDPTPVVRPAVGPCVLVLLLALGLRLVEADRKSFWVDELHTVHIANGDGVRGVVARVLPDFHAPLYFLGAHAVRDLPPHARRGLSIVASLATVLLLLALARASGFGGRSRLVMGLVLATVPFRIQYGTELRPYAWLELSTAGLLWAAFTPAPRPWRRMAAVAGFATFGLYSHYLAAVAILGVGAARLFFRSPLWLRLDRLVLAGSVGVALFVPWVRYDESWILEDPGVMVRNESGTPGAPDGVGLMARVEKAWPELRRNLVDLAPRTLLPAGSGLGPRAGKVALVGVGVFGAALAAALALGGRRRGPSERRASAVGVGGAIVACVFAGLLVALLSVFVWQRIALQYFALLAPVWPLVAGLLVERLGSSRLAAAVALAMVLGSATAGVAHVLGDAREDLRGGVAAALRAGADRDAVYSALLWQPEYYSNTEVYEVYAPSLSTVEPASIPAAKAPGESPIILLTRNMPVEQAHRHPHVWKELRVHRRVASTIVVDPSTIVYVLAPDPDAFR